MQSNHQSRPINTDNNDLNPGERVQSFVCHLLSRTSSSKRNKVDRLNVLDTILFCKFICYTWVILPSIPWHVKAQLDDRHSKNYTWFWWRNTAKAAHRDTRMQVTEQQDLFSFQYGPLMMLPILAWSLFWKILKVGASRISCGGICSNLQTWSWEEGEFVTVFVCRRLDEGQFPRHYIESCHP